MKRIIIYTALIIIMGKTLNAQDPQLQPYAGVRGWAETRQERIQWFADAKFGMFIHWGLYTPAGGYWPPDPNTGKKYPQHYAEWIRTWASVNEPEYGNLTKPLFRPDKGCTDEWAKTAKEAGMKYAVLTTKHHEGYTLFNAETPYSVSNKITGSTNISPPDRDMVKEYSNSMRNQGLKVGYYYSIIDWQHPDAVPESRKWPLGNNPDHSRYVEYMHSHILQLFTKYGKSDILWVDYSSNQYQGKTWETGKLLEQLIKIQPKMIINNRFWSGLENEKGDFFTPEKYVPPTGYPGKCFEVCHTMNESFGYSHHDQNWKSVKDVVHLLVDIVSKGGNLLLNVGPDARGHIPKESTKVLLETGKWLNKYGESIYGTRASPFSKLPFNGRCTQKSVPGGNTILYLHILEWPKTSNVQLLGLKNEVVAAKTMPGNTSLPVTNDPNGAFIGLPASPIDPICSVIKIGIKGTPEVMEKIIPRQSSDRSITLQADYAVLKGSTIRTEVFDGKTHIGWWTDKQDMIQFPFVINSPGPVQAGGTVSKQSGRYEVILEYAADNAGGGKLKLNIPGNGQSLEAQIKPTGSWQNFVTERIGDITLSKAGEDMVELRAMEMSNSGFMNVRSVKIQPIE